MGVEAEVVAERDPNAERADQSQNNNVILFSQGLDSPELDRANEVKSQRQDHEHNLVQEAVSDLFLSV